MLNPIEKFKVAILHLKRDLNHWLSKCIIFPINKFKIAHLLQNIETVEARLDSVLLMFYCSSSSRKDMGPNLQLKEIIFVTEYDWNPLQCGEKTNQLIFYHFYSLEIVLVEGSFCLSCCSMSGPGTRCSEYQLPADWLKMFPAKTQSSRQGNDGPPYKLRPKFRAKIQGAQEEQCYLAYLWTYEGYRNGSPIKICRI